MIIKTYNRIKELLAKKGKTNLELAERMQVHIQTVSGWCTNHNQPKFDTLFKIADYLNVEAGELLTLKKDLKLVKAKAKKRVSKNVNKRSNKN
jgi:putative transcriptional regulator